MTRSALLAALATTFAVTPAAYSGCPSARPTIIHRPAIITEVVVSLTIHLHHYSEWSFDYETGLYTRTCFLPGGGRQLLVFWEGNPDWVYWYNPVKRVYWCACPTSSHPTFGHRIAAGETLFLRCAVKSQRISQCVLESEFNITGSMTTKNANGQTVDISEVPDDRPRI